MNLTGETCLPKPKSMNFLWSVHGVKSNWILLYKRNEGKLAIKAQSKREIICAIKRASPRFEQVPLLSPDLLARFWWFQSEFALRKIYLMALSRASLGKSLAFWMECSRYSEQLWPIKITISDSMGPSRLVIMHSNQNLPMINSLPAKLAGTFYHKCTKEQI